ncbi:hypothetical protein SB775_30190, partial [Peribacillus sp. SIMBA_075]|uniref:hypothetical protein n=1 Tax=Peribacillus sp. SIMBA_075 TaxID=3085813 RepID=UPI00397967CB
CHFLPPEFSLPHIIIDDCIRKKFLCAGSYLSLGCILAAFGGHGLPLSYHSFSRCTVEKYWKKPIFHNRR